MNARPDRRPAGDANDADAVRRRQLLLFSVIAAVALVAVAAWLGMGGSKTDAPEGGIDAGIVAPDAAEMVWTRRSEARLNKVEGRAAADGAGGRAGCTPRTRGSARSWRAGRPTRCGPSTRTRRRSTSSNGGLSRPCRAPRRAMRRRAIPGFGARRRRRRAGPVSSRPHRCARA